MTYSIFGLAVYLLLVSLTTLFKVAIDPVVIGIVALITAILLFVEGLGALRG